MLSQTKHEDQTYSTGNFSLDILRCRDPRTKQPQIAMPPTKSTNGPPLGIRLDREEPNFTLRDTITGHVYCNTHLVTSSAIVTITLVGRSKSKMVVRHGSWGRTYRGRFALVDESEHTRKLFEAPLHIPVDGDGKRWPFAITLPTHFDATKTAPGTPQDESYLTPASNQSATYRLPPSFLLQNWGYGEGMECFVEYFLRAELTTVSRGSTDTKQATQPLMITTLHHGPRQRIAQWRASQHPHNLQRSEAVTEHEPTRASNSSTMKQRPKGDQSSLGFTISVRTPALLQLGQSIPISLLLLAEPTSTLLSDNVLLTSRDILLIEISVSLVASTSIKCRGRRGARHANTETKHKLLNKKLDQGLAPIIIPWMDSSNSSESSADSADTSTRHSASQAIDAGVCLGLQLPDEEGVYESFTTHNIQHSHRLDWKMTVTIAGQTSLLSGADSVEIIPPSSDDVPVDYETSQNETLLERERTRSTDAGAVPPEYTSEQPLPPRAPPSGVFGLSRLWEGV